MSTVTIVCSCNLVVDSGEREYRIIWRSEIGTDEQDRRKRGVGRKERRPHRAEWGDRLVLGGKKHKNVVSDSLTY